MVRKHQAGTNEAAVFLLSKADRFVRIVLYQAYSVAPGRGAAEYLCFISGYLYSSLKDTEPK